MSSSHEARVSLYPEAVGGTLGQVSFDIVKRFLEDVDG